MSGGAPDCSAISDFRHVTHADVAGESVLRSWGCSDSVGVGSAESRSYTEFDRDALRRSVAYDQASLAARSADNIYSVELCVHFVELCV